MSALEASQSTLANEEAARLAKKARKKARKEAARLAEEQEQAVAAAASSGEVKKVKKRKHRHSDDAVVQDMLVPSQLATPAAVSGSKKDKKRKLAEAATVVEQQAVAESSKKSKKHKHRHDKTSVAVEAPAESAPSLAEEGKAKKAKKSKKHAAVQPSAEPATSAEDDAEALERARKARKAEKKERKRLAAEAAATRQAAVEASPLREEEPKASTSKLAIQPAAHHRTTEEDFESIFAAAIAKPAPRKVVAEGDLSKSKGKGKEKEQSTSKAKPAMGAGKRRTATSDADDAAFAKLSRNDPAAAIASRWLTLAQVKAVAEEGNFTLRKGKFSKGEDKILLETLEAYRKEQGISQAELRARMFTDRRKRDKESRTGDDMWPRLALAVGGGRPVLAVYNHVKRMIDPQTQGGVWSKKEDDELKAAVVEYGSGWTKVATRVGRNPIDCKDRFTKHLKPAMEGKVLRGTWSPDEEAKLRGLVGEHGRSWAVIEKLMVTRSATQCRVKWTEALKREDAASIAADGEGKVARFSSKERSTLVHVVSDLDVKDDSEIRWSEIEDPALRGYSGTTLHRCWNNLRRKAVDALGADKKSDDEEEVEHAEVVNYLLARYPVRGEFTSVNDDKKFKKKTLKRKFKEDEDDGPTSSKKYKSKAVIEDSDEEAQSGSESD